MRDKDGCMGATACVVVPAFFDAHPEPGGWHERPQRRIDSYAEPKGRWAPLN